MRFSTGAVELYMSGGCGGSDLPFTIPEAEAFRAWYLMGGHELVSAWEDDDVWGDDFRDGVGDTVPDGGSDAPEVYLFAGHGSCQTPPVTTDPDFILTCGNVGSNSVNIGNQCRWGNAPGKLQFMFVDASCPMDLVSILNNWAAPFQGLHMATGHSGMSIADALDSPRRGAGLAARTTGLPSSLSWLYPQQSVGDAWMDVGTVDIQPLCAAVVIAAGETEEDAIDRRENERITDNRPDPVPIWWAWKWRMRSF